MICIGVKMNAGAGVSGDMPHLSKLSEPRQRGAIISVTLITLSADLLSMHHGLEMVTHDFVTNPASDMSGGSDVAPPSLVTTVSNKS